MINGQSAGRPGPEVLAQCVIDALPQFLHAGVQLFVAAFDRNRIQVSLLHALRGGLIPTDPVEELGSEAGERWSYWLDGAGQRVRLRLNLRNARFTEVGARQFALHEVLGHGLQSASLTAWCATDEVPWVRLLSVHAPHQVLLEGLAQAMPLFVAADDEALTTRVRFDHYNQLIKAELHLAINAGVSAEECARHARGRALLH